MASKLLLKRINQLLYHLYYPFHKKSNTSTDTVNLPQAAQVFFRAEVSLSATFVLICQKQNDPALHANVSPALGLSNWGNLYSKSKLKRVTPLIDKGWRNIWGFFSGSVWGFFFALFVVPSIVVCLRCRLGNFFRPHFFVFFGPWHLQHLEAIILHLAWYLQDLEAIILHFAWYLQDLGTCCS